MFCKSCHGCGSANNWWLGSPNVDNNNNFNIVNSSGNWSNNNANNSNGVAFGFHIEELCSFVG